MKLPDMKYADGIAKSKQIKFGGLNHSSGASDGELYAMRNLTGDHYPVLATRAPRLKYRTLDAPGGLFSWDGLCWVDGTDFLFGGEVKGQVAAGEKTFASMGSWIIIMPDKACYNTDTGEFKKMEAKWEGGSLTFGDGELYGEAASANAITAEGADWAEWFCSGDAVTISGCTKQESNNQTVIIRAIDGDTMYFYENTFALPDDTEYTETGELTVSRTVPDLNYMCQNENRLWGCTDSTIYACKLGDIFNWNVYDGLDTDAFAVDTGSPGSFTGCVSYGGYPIFFKEDHIYKVYGNIPSNFEVLGTATLGLAKGCSRSLAVAGEVLFYLSNNGVMAYSGGVPQPMGEAFGLQRFKNGVAGSDGLKYYISMETAAGGHELYVYDTQRGLWHREDELHLTHTARLYGNLYLLAEDGTIWINGNAQDPPDAEEETDIEWWAEFADFTDEDPNKKGVSKIQIRLELEADATAQVWIQIDSDGCWIPVSGELGEDVKRSYYLPIVPRRADHYRLKITGTGGCRIYSLVRESYAGSELRTRGRN